MKIISKAKNIFLLTIVFGVLSMGVLFFNKANAYVDSGNSTAITLTATVNYMPSGGLTNLTVSQTVNLNVSNIYIVSLPLHATYNGTVYTAFLANFVIGTSTTTFVNTNNGYTFTNNGNKAVTFGLAIALATTLGNLSSSYTPDAVHFLSSSKGTLAANGLSVTNITLNPGESVVVAVGIAGNGAAPNANSTMMYSLTMNNISSNGSNINDGPTDPVLQGIYTNQASFTSNLFANLDSAVDALSYQGQSFPVVQTAYLSGFTPLSSNIVTATTGYTSSMTLSNTVDNSSATDACDSTSHFCYIAIGLPGNGKSDKSFLSATNPTVTANSSGTGIVFATSGMAWDNNPLYGSIYSISFTSIASTSTNVDFTIPFASANFNSNLEYSTNPICPVIAIGYGPTAVAAKTNALNKIVSGSGIGSSSIADAGCLYYQPDTIMLTLLSGNGISTKPLDIVPSTTDQMIGEFKITRTTVSGAPGDNITLSRVSSSTGGSSFTQSGVWSAVGEDDSVTYFSGNVNSINTISTNKPVSLSGSTDKSFKIKFDATSYSASSNVYGMNLAFSVGQSVTTRNIPSVTSQDFFFQANSTVSDTIYNGKCDSTGIINSGTNPLSIANSSDRIICLKVNNPDATPKTFTLQSSLASVAGITTSTDTYFFDFSNVTASIGTTYDSSAHTFTVPASTVGATLSGIKVYMLSVGTSSIADSIHLITTNPIISGPVNDVYLYKNSGSDLSLGIEQITTPTISISPNTMTLDASTRIPSAMGTLTNLKYDPSNQIVFHLVHYGTVIPTSNANLTATPSGSAVASGNASNWGTGLLAGLVLDINNNGLDTNDTYLTGWNSTANYSTAINVPLNTNSLFPTTSIVSNPVYLVLVANPSITAIVNLFTSASAFTATYTFTGTSITNNFGSSSKSFNSLTFVNPASTAVSHTINLINTGQLVVDHIAAGAAACTATPPSNWNSSSDLNRGTTPLNTTSNCMPIEIKASNNTGSDITVSKISEDISSFVASGIRFTIESGTDQLHPGIINGNTPVNSTDYTIDNSTGTIVFTNPITVKNGDALRVFIGLHLR